MIVLSERSLGQKLAPLIAVAGYWWSLVALKGLRNDHWALGGVILALFYLGRPVLRLRSYLMPFILTAIIYDSQRFYSDYIRGPIHVSEPYFFDKRFFGIPSSSSPGTILTPNEWFQLHTHPFLDLLTGFAYLTFFSIFILAGMYFNFVVAKRGTSRCTPEVIQKKAPLMGWAFLWLNLIGYSTYYWYAAAPPWYVAQYGLGPARLDVTSNPAGCIRFDQLLGIHVFTEMYGRSADVFGAMPSLHIAYPLLAVYFAFQFGTLRLAMIVFYLWMCFSAVYLNHHYILDILWGSVYALLTGWLTLWVHERLQLKATSRND